MMCDLRFYLSSHLCIFVARVCAITAAHYLEWAAVPAFPTENVARSTCVFACVGCHLQ